jgi:hypothetical protein
VLDWVTSSLFATFVDAYIDDNDMNITSNRFERFSMAHKKSDKFNDATGSTTDVSAWTDVVKTLRGGGKQSYRPSKCCCH